MPYNTINDAQTIPGNGEGTFLAGRYHIVRQLGSGGMGSVWLAEDTQLDNKPFAIKMLPSILVRNKRAYRQLKDEALVAMRLVHPNIVQIRAFEENNGNPFLVMDYVDGQTLDDYLCERGTGNGERGNGLSEEETIRILRPIAAALDYAHDEGVVHRDVKPANVMIRKDGHPFILDFGIAREIQETMTRVTGKLSSGTLLYMSPEQLRGQPPKAVQDIYSFAAMVYECLKGEPPFSHGQVEFQILNEQPAPLTGCAGLSAPLTAGIMAGLAKKPEDRPANCSAVLGTKDSSRAEHVKRVEKAGHDAHVVQYLSDTSKENGVNQAACDQQQTAIRARVEAKIRQKHLDDLPDDGGFAIRKKALEEDLLRAELFFDSKGWVDAAEKFLEYVKKYDELTTLANEMHTAKSKREEALKAKKHAVRQGCKDSPLWRSAEGTWRSAQRHFADMEFSAAAELYDRALETFVRSEKEVPKTEEEFIQAEHVEDAGYSALHDVNGISSVAVGNSSVYSNSQSMPDDNVFAYGCVAYVFTGIVCCIVVVGLVLVLVGPEQFAKTLDLILRR